MTKKKIKFSHFIMTVKGLVRKSFHVDYMILVPEGTIMVGTSGELAWNDRNSNFLKSKNPKRGASR